MPGGNGTGPAGMGPMTGRGAGSCAGNQTPGFATSSGGRRFLGRGRGMGCGRGFGWGGAGTQTLTSEQELEGLKGQAEVLENSLNQIKARIETLQSRD